MKVGDLVEGSVIGRIGIIIEVIAHAGYSVIAERYLVHWLDDNSVRWYSKDTIELLREN